MITIEVGQRLQLAREEQNIAIEQVSEQIKLSPTQLLGLESGDWNKLPNPTLALAFLRQYAQYLDLDVKDTIEQLQSGALDIHQPLTFPDPAIAPNRNWTIAAAALLLILFLSWNFMHTPATPTAVTPPTAVATSPAIPTPPLPQQIQKISPLVATTKMATDSVIASTTPPSAPQIVHHSTPKKVTPTPSPVAKAHPPSKTIPTIKSVKHPTIAKKEIATKAPEISEKITKPQAIEGVIPHQFSFHAAGERVWLLVETSDSQGGRKRLREVILRPHHSIELVREKPDLIISVGNAGAIKITYEGKTIYDFGTLGPRGMVIRHRAIKLPSKPAPDTITQ